MDATAVWTAPGLFRDSNSASCLCYHRGSSVLQESGVPSFCGSLCMEVSVYTADRRWRKRTVVYTRDFLFNSAVFEERIV